MSLWLAAASACVGGLLGALAGGRGVAAAQDRRFRREAATREANRLLNLFPALATELSLVWERYMATVGGDLEQAEDTDEITFTGLAAIETAWFPVYDQAVRFLSSFDPQSGARLIETYVHLKSYFSELRQFGELDRRHWQARTKSNLTLMEVTRLRQEWDRAFQILKKRHLQVKQLCQHTLKTLQEFIALGQESRRSVKINI